MQRCHRAALAAVFFILCVAPAAAATIEIGQSLGGWLPELAATAAAVFVGWLCIVAKNRWHLEIEAKHRDALITWAKRMASSLVADGEARVVGLKVDVKSDMLAAAANTGLKAIPDALKFFGLTVNDLPERIKDALPQESAIAQALAIAIDTANPTTPSQPATPAQKIT